MDWYYYYCQNGMIPNLSKLRLSDGLPTDAPRRALELPSLSAFGEDLVRLIVDNMKLAELGVVLTLDKALSRYARIRIEGLRPTLELLTLPPLNIEWSHILSNTVIRLKRRRIDEHGFLHYMIYTNYGVDWMKVFSEALGHGALPMLRTLHLIGTDSAFVGMGMGYFAEALGNGALQHLTDLNLSENKLGDQGMAIFSDALLLKKVFEKLEILNLSNNQIGDKGMTDFSEALDQGSLSSLKTLNMDYNVIGDRGILAFSKIFYNNMKIPNLILFSIYCNYGISDERFIDVRRGGRTCVIVQGDEYDNLD